MKTVEEEEEEDERGTKPIRREIKVRRKNSLKNIIRNVQII